MTVIKGEEEKGNAPAPKLETESGEIPVAYCLKCRGPTHIVNPIEITLPKSGSPAWSGTCERCGGKVQRISAMKKSEAPPIFNKSYATIFSATARQEFHILVCHYLGGEIEILAHRFAKSDGHSLIWKKHHFEIDPNQKPLFRDEKRRPVYLAFVGSVSPPTVSGQIVQGSDKKGLRPLARTDQVIIKILENQDSHVFWSAYDDGEAAAILAAGLKDREPKIPLWMQALAFAGLPAGFILGVIIAPYLIHSLGG